MKLIKTLLVLSLLSVMFLAMACEDNETEEPTLLEFGSISGAVDFTGTWPDTCEVLITLDIQYPQLGPPAGFVFITSTDEQNGVYNYSFSNLSFRDYSAITVTYWPQGYETAGTNYSLIGSQIETISVTQNNADLTIDIEAIFN